MMTLGQNLTLTFRRLNKKWNRYAVASLLFLLPTFLSMILSAAAAKPADHGPLSDQCRSTSRRDMHRIGG